MALVCLVRRLWRSRAGIERACEQRTGLHCFGVYGMVYDFGLVRIEVRCVEVFSIFFSVFIVSYCQELL